MNYRKQQAHPKRIRSKRKRLISNAIGLILAVLVCIPAWADEPSLRTTKDIRDLFFGEALYYYNQKDYFDAVALLDAELAQLFALDDPTRDTLNYHREESELYIADMELSYRMHQKVGRTMQRLLDKSVHPSIRNRAAYRLAHIAFIKSAYEDALADLDRIDDKADAKLKQKAALLRGQSLVALQRYPEAIKVLGTVRGTPELQAFANYNLGVAYLGSDDIVSAFKALNDVGTTAANNREISALRDKANLTIGAALLKDEKPKEARPYFERVQLDSAFANKALLWVGWSDAASGQYEQALVPWMLLRKRDITDVAVQEAMLAAPYGYSQLKAFGRSAVLYGEAVDKINKEIQRLDDSIRSIREGKFLKAMLSEKARHDPEWLFKLGESADAPETRYLRNLLAGNSFNESYQNYRELDQLRRNLEKGLRDVAAYRDLLRRRKAYFAPLLDTTESQYTRVRNRMHHALDQRDALLKRLNKLLRKRDPMVFATASERAMLRRLKDTGRRINRLRPQPGKDILQRKQALLEGVLKWNIDTGFENRLSNAFTHLRELDKEIATAKKSETKLIKAKAEAALSYQGYDKALDQLQQRLVYLKDRTDGLIAHQGQFMERRAVSELLRRKSRLQRYRTKARFAMAEAYDLAIRAQSKKGAVKEKQE
jgi:hypothetical protein